MFIIIGLRVKMSGSDFSLFFFLKDFDCSEFHSLGMVISEKMVSTGKIAGVFNRANAFWKTSSVAVMHIPGNEMMVIITQTNKCPRN